MAAVLEIVCGACKPDKETLVPKESRVRWGFQWGKVASGSLMFLVGGVILLVGWLAGRIILWGVVLAVAGIFTMLSGLIGEEGIW